MKVYDILKLHPEWIEAPRARKVDIMDYAHTYIWELFKIDEKIRDTVLWHDLNKIMDIMTALVYFRGFDGDTGRITKSQEETDDKKAFILERFIISVCNILEEYTYKLKRADIENFYSRNEGLLDFIEMDYWPDGSTKEQRNGIHLIKEGIEDSKAREIYVKLHEAGIIESPENDFLWYFSTSHKGDRVAGPCPDKLEWAPEEMNNFAYFGIKIFQVISSAPNYKKVNVSWRALLNTFNVPFTADQLRASKGGIISERDLPPKYAMVIEAATIPDTPAHQING